MTATALLGIGMTVLVFLMGWLTAAAILGRLPSPVSLILRRLAPLVGLCLALPVGYRTIPRSSLEPASLRQTLPAIPIYRQEESGNVVVVMGGEEEYLVLPSGEKIPVRHLAVSPGRYPRPSSRRCVHWLTTTSTPEGEAKRLVREAAAMGMGAVVVLVGLDHYNLHAHDALVKMLRDAGVMPVVRPMAKVGPVPSSFFEAVGALTALGVRYVQVFNEPNLDEEWGVDGKHTPERLADYWIPAAQQVVAAGGLPGIPPMAPEPSGEDEGWLTEFLLALMKRGQYGLLNLSWVGVHAYYSRYDPDDERGFGLYRRYRAVVQEVLGSPLPVLVTEGGLSPEAPAQPEEWGRWLVEGFERVEWEEDPWLLSWCAWVLGTEEEKWRPRAWFDGEDPRPVVEMLKSLN